MPQSATGSTHAGGDLTHRDSSGLADRQPAHPLFALYREFRDMAQIADDEARRAALKGWWETLVHEKERLLAQVDRCGAPHEDNDPQLLSWRLDQLIQVAGAVSSFLVLCHDLALVRAGRLSERRPIHGPNPLWSLWLAEDGWEIARYLEPVDVMTAAKAGDASTILADNWGDHVEALFWQWTERGLGPERGRRRTDAIRNLIKRTHRRGPESVYENYSNYWRYVRARIGYALELEVFGKEGAGFYAQQRHLVSDTSRGGLADACPDPSDPFSLVDERLALESDMADLPAAQREAIDLRTLAYLSDQSLLDLCRRLGKPYWAVAKNAKRAEERLRLKRTE